MKQYQNRDGVIVQAEQVTEGEHQGLWHTIDKDGIEGHVTDELFQRNFSPVDDTASTPSKKTAKGQ